MTIAPLLPCSLRQRCNLLQPEGNAPGVGLPQIPNPRVPFGFAQGLSLSNGKSQVNPKTKIRTTSSSPSFPNSVWERTCPPTSLAQRTRKSQTKRDASHKDHKGHKELVEEARSKAIR